MPRVRPQATCHPLEPHCAHGLCQACFHRYRYEKSRPAGTIVKDVRATCHTDRQHYSAGLCYECYSIVRPERRKRTGKRMADCHTDRIHYAKGMCQECYDDYKYKTRTPENIAATRTRVNRYARDNREKLWARNLKNKFNITADQFYAIIEKQGGKCGIALCHKRPKENEVAFWHVDHDHDCCAGDKSCGKCVRGILCRTCNAGMGQFYHNTELMESAVSYLKRTKWINAKGETR
jgi:hypothetical protein